MKATNAFTRGVALIDTILQNMPCLGKWQHRFITDIFLLCLGLRGRFNFQQMGREGKYNEQTYRNNFEKTFDFMNFNIELVRESCGKNIIIAFDPSYINKSGKHTPGLGSFYSGCAGKSKKGLEIGGIAAIDMNQNTAYHLEAIQSPYIQKETPNSDYTIVDHYADIIVDRWLELSQLSNILVVDGYFSKKKFVNKVVEETDFKIVSRLRDDANMKYLFKGVRSKSKNGRPKKYDGKINTKSIDKRRIKSVYKDDDKEIFEGTVYHVSLKRTIKIAYVTFSKMTTDKKKMKIFFSTDLEMSAIDIFSYYKSRL